MANLLTGDVRREQYAIHRAQRIRYEKIFNLCAWILLFLAVGELVSTVLLSVFSATWGYSGSPLLGAPVSAAALALAFTGIYRRNRLMIASAIVVSMLRMLFGISFLLFTVPLLAVTLVMAQKWEQLSRHDGFPRFDIDYGERYSRAEKQARITKHVAIETGTRRLAAPNAGEMADLLDSSGDVPVATAELSGYHDRSRHGADITRGKTYSSGDMDEM